MRIGEMVLTSGFALIQAAAVLLLTLQTALVIASFRTKRRYRIRILYGLHFLFSFALLYVPLKIFVVNVRWPDQAEQLPDFFLKCEALPASLFILYEILTLVILIAGYLELYHYRQGHLDDGCIKETMDLLPVGIAFGKADGTVFFRNLVLNDLSYRQTGKGITNLPEFLGNMIGEQDKTQTARLSDGRVWQISSEELQTEEGPVIQLIASDITKQAAITQELEEKNQKLRDIHMRLDIYNKQADRIIIAQELLTARMAVHSEVGNVLLESRHYLKNPSSVNEGLLLQALKNTKTYLLKEYEEDDTARDPLADALEMAEAIGVEVTITGVIPAEDPFRSILAAAISECATNTVKHAGGDRLLADIRNTGSEITCILQNNGMQPEERIRESGGLLTLRSLVEKEGGIMQIESLPCFRLRITLQAGSGRN